MSPTTRASDGGSRITITDSNLNPVVQIVTWLLLAFTSLVLSFRLFTNIIVKGRMPVSLEDLLFLSSFVCYVAFCFHLLDKLESDHLGFRFLWSLSLLRW